MAANSGLPQAKRHTHVFSGGSRPQHLLAKHCEVCGLEDSYQEQETPQLLSIPRAHRIKQLPMKKAQKGLKILKTYHVVHILGPFGMLHPVAAGTSTLSCMD